MLLGGALPALRHLCITLPDTSRVALGSRTSLDSLEIVAGGTVDIYPEGLTSKELILRTADAEKGMEERAEFYFSAPISRLQFEQLKLDYVMVIGYVAAPDSLSSLQSYDSLHDGLEAPIQVGWQAY